MADIRERPILFSAPMVRAILTGTKTQTRRIVKPQPAGVRSSVFVKSGIEDGHGRELKNPHGKPGSRLWVREAWRIDTWDEADHAIALDYFDGPDITFRQLPLTPEGLEQFNRLWIQSSDECRRKGIAPNADGNYRWSAGESPLRWRPSIHMPRWASRITLEIVGVRVERLQDISESDAKAEGACFELRRLESTQLGAAASCKGGFENLWSSINGHESWAANPWVWVIEFKRVEVVRG